VPFMLPIWWIESFESYRDLMTTGLYAGAGLWVVLTREQATQQFPASAKSA
jgi:hypothetical protein